MYYDYCPIVLLTTKITMVYLVLRDDNVIGCYTTLEMAVNNVEEVCKKLTNGGGFYIKEITIDAPFNDPKIIKCYSVTRKLIPRKITEEELANAKYIPNHYIPPPPQYSVIEELKNIK